MGQFKLNNFRRPYMPQRIIHNIVTLCALSLVSAIIAVAQTPKSSDVPVLSTGDTWEVAQSVGSSKGKLFVVTLDQPQRRQTCRVQSFTPDKLVCSRAIGGPRTYLPQQIVALIIPGDHDLKIRLVLGLNGGLGAAIWGTVVLVATCPACAAATGVAALLLFCAAGAVLIGDEQPDRLLYLAPGQQLTGKFRFVQGIPN
jgi:hypothetical protein